MLSLVMYSDFLVSGPGQKSAEVGWSGNSGILRYLAWSRIKVVGVRMIAGSLRILYYEGTQKGLIFTIPEAALLGKKKTQQF